MEKENLDSKLLILSEFNEQNKLMKFYKELIFSEIDNNGLNKIRQLSRFSDRDNSFIIPLFGIKKKKVVFTKIPRHEQLLIIENNQKNRKIKINTNNLVRNINLNSVKHFHNYDFQKDENDLENIEEEEIEKKISGIKNKNDLDNIEEEKIEKTSLKKNPEFFKKQIISKINYKRKKNDLDNIEEEKEKKNTKLILIKSKRKKKDFSEEIKNKGKKRKSSTRKNSKISLDFKNLKNQRIKSVKKNSRFTNNKIKTIPEIKNREILKEIKNKKNLENKKILDIKLKKRNSRNSSLKPIKKLNKIEYFTNKKEKYKRNKNITKLDNIPTLPFPFLKMKK